jgi:hypothetical protein
MRAPGPAAGEGERVFHPGKSIASGAFALVVAAAAAGCSREDVTHYRVAKPPAPQKSPAAPAAMAMGGAGAMPDGMELPAPPKGGGLRWTLPTGWTESAGGQMRYATLKPPVAGRIDASVVVLPGPAGGELANVNRWRNQIGLPPLDEAALAKARAVVKTKAGPLHVYDFTSEGEPRNRVVAGLTSARGDTWFVKVTGDAGAVGAARADFMKLLGSLRFE